MDYVLEADSNSGATVRFSAHAWAYRVWSGPPQDAGIENQAVSHLEFPFPTTAIA